jgi:stress-induced morphogen
MAMAASEIENLIKAAFPDAIITIEDLRGDGDHYACNVISSAFAGKNRVQQHQMVYKALGGRMGGSYTHSPCKHRHRKIKFPLPTGHDTQF